eukprot:TRINITY_DN7121_c0_g1_i2.p1 TRINITY_DN7121_c0_g1~~TRINITY_DN7121_c0_g1_i2.p1  ORF type:complete len:272 (-),score=-13.75 TRINITY_DN7121_c0_g1_i2:226-1041(-)
MISDNFINLGFIENLLGPQISPVRIFFTSIKYQQNIFNKVLITCTPFITSYVIYNNNYFYKVAQMIFNNYFKFKTFLVFKVFFIEQNIIEKKPFQLREKLIINVFSKNANANVQFTQNNKILNKSFLLWLTSIFQIIFNIFLNQNLVVTLKFKLKIFIQQFLYYIKKLIYKQISFFYCIEKTNLLNLCKILFGIIYLIVFLILMGTFSLVLTFFCIFQLVNMVNWYFILLFVCNMMQVILYGKMSCIFVSWYVIAREIVSVNCIGQQRVYL